MAISVVSQHGPNPQSGAPDRSVSLPVPDPREVAATMMAHMASGEPPRIGRASPEGPVPDYEPPPPMGDEERRRALDEIEKIRRDNKDVLNPGSTMSSIWDAIMNVVPDIDPKTAIMVASAVAAALAVGTGIGGPLAPPILAGGALLASQ